MTTAMLLEPELPNPEALTRVELEAWADLFARAPAGVAAKLGLSAERGPGGLIVRSRAQTSILVNRVIVAGRGGVAQPGEVAEIVQRARAWAPGRLFVQVRDRDLAPALEAWLDGAGLARYPRDWVRLVRRAGSGPEAPSDLCIRRARARDVRGFGQLVASAFDLGATAGPLFASVIDSPAWHAFVATEGGHIAAAAALFVTGEIGYHAFAATAPAFRGRGAQRALIARRLQVASALGCRWIFSETGAPDGSDPQHSHRNMLRAGFTEAERRLNFVAEE